LCFAYRDKKVVGVFVRFSCVLAYVRGVPVDATAVNGALIHYRICQLSAVDTVENVTSLHQRTGALPICCVHFYFLRWLTRKRKSHDKCVDTQD
jgi:hypothetical protein